MEKKTIKTLSRPPCITWSKRFLVFFLIATCLAVSGWFFAAPAQVAKAAVDPDLAAVNLTPRTAYAGSMVTLSYTINNADPAPQNVTLGATIGGPDGGAVEWYGDSERVVTVSVAPGTATYTRTFLVPDRAKEGLYTVIWELIVDGIGVDSFAGSQCLNVVKAPTVTISFDDGYTQIYDNARPVLNSYGYDATLFAITGLSQIVIPDHPAMPLMSVAQMQALKADGWEIGSHSVNHIGLVGLTQAQLEAELQNSRDWIVNNGMGPVYSFAYPFGAADSNIMVTTDKYYDYARTVIDGFNSYGHNVNMYTVFLYGNASSNSLGHVETVVNQAINQNKWVVVSCHGVVTDQNDYRLNSNYGWVTADVLDTFCQFLKASGVPVKTFAQVEEGTGPSTPPANHPPTAVADSYIVVQDTTLTVASPGVLGNDTDADGDTLTAALVNGPVHGTLSLAANGSFIYTPTIGYVGSDSYTYYANDTKAQSNSAMVSISVTPLGAAGGTFGLDNGAYQLYQGSGVISAQRFRNTAGIGTLTKLELRFSDTNVPNGKVRMGVYADNNGSPGALLLDADPVDAGVGWVAINGLNLAVTSDTYYWLVCNLQYPNFVVVAWQVPDLSFRWFNRIYGTFPAIFPGVDGIGDWSFVMRATVTP